MLQVTEQNVQKCPRFEANPLSCSPKAVLKATLGLSIGHQSVSSQARQSSTCSRWIWAFL